MTSDEQLTRWVAGDPVHRGDKADPRSECCPDFSCCVPDLLAPVEVRQAFVAADRKGQSKFLGAFLGALLEYKQRAGEISSDVRMTVVGTDPKEPE